MFDSSACHLIPNIIHDLDGCINNAWCKNGLLEQKVPWGNCIIVRKVGGMIRPDSRGWLLPYLGFRRSGADNTMRVDDAIWVCAVPCARLPHNDELECYPSMTMRSSSRTNAVSSNGFGK